MRIQLTGVSDQLQAEYFMTVLDQWARLELGATEPVQLVTDGEVDLTFAVPSGDEWSVDLATQVAAKLMPSASLGKPVMYATVLLPTFAGTITASVVPPPDPVPVPEQPVVTEVPV